MAGLRLPPQALHRPAEREAEPVAAEVGAVAAAHAAEVVLLVVELRVVRPQAVRLLQALRALTALPARDAAAAAAVEEAAGLRRFARSTPLECQPIDPSNR